MLSNYKKDIEEDKVIGKYNPLTDNNWNYNFMSAKLIENIDKTITPEISEIYLKHDALKAYWSG